ncbi:MAG: protein translocase subunit SecD [Proteobacteria bacterium]|nr:MAG: protein translocase subunit SecD [Pseudomonadota bacterium]PIE18451.1 MAG: protein translocase subunit SecD [Pseudomonadota bacterium]
MERKWWWKTIGMLLLVVLAVAHLVPTVVGEESLPKWYTKYIKAKLNLGLDLQGGIHLVFEVQVDKAVADKADRIAADIEERLRKDKKIRVRIEHEGRDDLIVTFLKPAEIKKFDKKFFAPFRSNLDEVERDEAKGKLRLKMDEKYVKEVQEYAIRQAVETIRGRVDQFGVAEPTILRKGRDIVVELPGLKKKDFDRVKRNIGRTAQLEFKILDDESGFMAEAGKKAPKGIEVRSDSYDGKKNGAVSYTYFQSKDKKALLAFIASLKVPKNREIMLGEQFAKDKKGNPLPDKIYVTHYLRRRTELTGDYITDAEVQFDNQSGRPEVSLTFDRTGADIFARVSGDNVGKRMAIVLDEKVNSAPVLQERIGGGRARITLGGFKDPFKLQEEAHDLAGVLRSGALPAPLRKTFERQVGPTLGRDAIQKGSMAFLIGLSLVILFILYYYRGAGLICDIALAVNFLFIAAIMAGFQATLTLPGIAGLVLTIGMAVDANVIIYERIREEAALGKSPRASVDAGYSRAFWTIFDAQLTTAIAAIVLLQYGSGPIRGFALTLLIGIICSMFTGIVVTRLLFDVVVGKFKPQKLSI